MNAGVAQMLYENIENHPMKEPIVLKRMVFDLHNRTGRPIPELQGIVGLNLSRMAKKNIVQRLGHGVYIKTMDGVFGKTTAVSRREYWMNRILLNGDKPIGYITGPSALNNAGLSTLVPAAIHVATNQHRLTIPKNMLFSLHKPLMKVDVENMRYLQFLHLLQAFRHYHTDADNPKSIFNVLITRMELNIRRLVTFCRETGTKIMQKDLESILVEKW